MLNHHLDQQLKSLGFVPYYEGGRFPTGNFTSYENNPVSRGGIRVEVVQDVAAIWCLKPRYSEMLPTEDVLPVVEGLLKGEI